MMEHSSVVDGFVGHLRKLDEAKAIHLESLDELAVEEGQLQSEILIAKKSLQLMQLEKFRLTAAVNNVKAEVLTQHIETEKWYVIFMYDPVFLSNVSKVYSKWRIMNKSVLDYRHAKIY
jgi:hypothetical protein